MTRLQSEWRRLFLPFTSVEDATTAEPLSFVDEQGCVRALMLTLSQPADWESMAAVWQAVQVDLRLPAPSIAVNGLDGYQLWFSLAEATPVEQAHAFLDALRQRYLPHIAPERVGLLPAMDAWADDATWHTGMAPGQVVQPDQWSAFVAPDLAPMFADTPWLDIPPNPEGQADLLQRQQGIKPKEWQDAWTRLQLDQA